MRLPMIDKVELRVPFRTSYSPEFTALRRDMRHSTFDPFRPSKLYTAVGDLRPLGYPLILHRESRFGAHDHKLEFIESARFSYSEMARHVERVFSTDVSDLGIMRIDLAADVRDVPVSWFNEHIRVQWKRLASDHAKIVRYGNSELETLTFGARPNCVRVYNKIAEWKHEYVKILRKKQPAERTFQEMYGYPDSGVILTRVERQIGGGRVPGEINTFGKLRTLPQFDPFSPLDWLSSGGKEPDVEEVGFQHYATGKFIQALVCQSGVHRTRKWLNKHANRNGQRLLERYRDFIPGGAEGVSKEKLLMLYRESVVHQLAEKEIAA